MELIEHAMGCSVGGASGEGGSGSEPQAHARVTGVTVLLALALVASVVQDRPSGVLSLRLSARRVARPVRGRPRRSTAEP